MERYLQLAILFSRFLLGFQVRGFCGWLRVLSFAVNFWQDLLNVNGS